MNFKLDSPSKLQKGEGIQFPAIIRFKSQLSCGCLRNDEQKFKRGISPSSLPFIENDILASVSTNDMIYFHIFDPAIYTPSKDPDLNSATRKKLHNHLTEACSRTGGFKGVMKSLQPWGPQNVTHYQVSTLKCSNSQPPTRSKCKTKRKTTGDKQLIDFKLASTNNSRSTHGVAKGNKTRKRKTST